MATKIDVWINDVMATTFSPAQNNKSDESRCGTRVTYLGQVYGTMAALKLMWQSENLNRAIRAEAIIGTMLLPQTAVEPAIIPSPAQS